MRVSARREVGLSAVVEVADIMYGRAFALDRRMAEHGDFRFPIAILARLQVNTTPRRGRLRPLRRVARERGRAKQGGQRANADSHGERMAHGSYRKIRPERPTVHSVPRIRPAKRWHRLPSERSSGGGPSDYSAEVASLVWGAHAPRVSAIWTDSSRGELSLAPRQRELFLKNGLAR